MADSQNRSLSCPGFTLIELMVSMMAISLILGAAYTTLFAGLDSYRLSVNESEVLTVLGRSLDRMSTDLSSAFLAQSGTQFSIVDDSEEDEIFGEIPIDRIRFQSRIGKVQWEKIPQNDRTEVEYFIDLDEETPARWLVRRTQNPADEDLESGGAINLVGPRVLAMDVEAFDGSNWVGEWSSRTDLPYAVRVTLYMVPSIPIEQPARLKSMSSTMWLPTAKISGSGLLISVEGEGSEETGDTGGAGDSQAAAGEAGS